MYCDVFDVNGALNRMVYSHTMVSISHLSYTCGSREKGVSARCDVVVHTSDNREACGDERVDDRRCCILQCRWDTYGLSGDPEDDCVSDQY